MKKAILTVVLLASSASLVGCGARPNMTTPGMPGVSTVPGTGTGYSDPYGTGTGTGYSDPYGTGTGAGTGYTDPYGTGAGAGYGQPGAGTGYTDPYGTGTGYGQPGVGTGYGQPATGYGQPGYGQGTAYGQPVIDPMTGQPMIDPMTGQPMMSNGISQQIVSKIQQAGGYRGSKADSAVTDSLKGSSVQQAFGSAPLDHRALAIKALLDGWCTAEEKNYANQIWSTILPQDQQRLLSSDAELSKLVTGKLLQGSGNGIGTVFTEIGKLVGLSK